MEDKLAKTTSELPKCIFRVVREDNGFLKNISIKKWHVINIEVQENSLYFTLGTEGYSNTQCKYDLDNNKFLEDEFFIEEKDAINEVRLRVANNLIKAQSEIVEYRKKYYNLLNNIK